VTWGLHHVHTTHALESSQIFYKLFFSLQKCNSPKVNIEMSTVNNSSLNFVLPFQYVLKVVYKEKCYQTNEPKFFFKIDIVRVFKLMKYNSLSLVWLSNTSNL
jgi:hypothetical protein